MLAKLKTRNEEKLSWN